MPWDISLNASTHLYTFMLANCYNDKCGKGQSKCNVSITSQNVWLIWNSTFPRLSIWHYVTAISLQVADHVSLHVWKWCKHHSLNWEISLWALDKKNAKSNCLDAINCNKNDRVYCLFCKISSFLQTNVHRIFKLDDIIALMCAQSKYNLEQPNYIISNTFLDTSNNTFSHSGDFLVWFWFLYNTDTSTTI